MCGVVYCVYLHVKRRQCVFVGRVARLRLEVGHNVNKSEYLTLSSDLMI